ncbi:MAG: hypothetical protein KDJ54_16950 [Candidatus Competibacteraceae bacterium]|nr:hypothetical protein [Candidatus Competibacteraceae bacterium]
MNILTEKRQLARIGLLDGNIVALSCMGKRGSEALPLIRQLNPNWFQFVKGSSVVADSDLPATPDVFDFLDSVTSSFASSESAEENTLLEMLPQQIVTVLKEMLNEFMGPVAPMICNKILRQALSLESAIDLLAREIPDQQQAAKFQEQVRQKIISL